MTVSRAAVRTLAIAFLGSLAAVAATQAAGRVESRGAPDVRSQAYYVLEGPGRSVLAARHEDTAVPIASITKLMTALVVLDAGQPMNEKITITAEDARATAGSVSRLAQGTRLSRSDLLHLALMSSENRAAHAVCRSHPQGLAGCVRAMNARAARLGMKTAHFVEPTGLSKDNVASPRDLARLVLAAGDHPTIRAYSTDIDHTVQPGRRPLQFRNTNSLVDDADWQVSVQKTGYTAEAGRCLVMEAVIDGRDVVIVLLNSFGKYTRTADAKRIRAWLESQRRGDPA